MKSTSENPDDFYFLKSGGEMGELIRNKNWDNTSIGSPEQWPASLRTIVAMMLENPFGMYIAWGKEYIQLYNDGYRPILGSTKHPEALGISTKETFSEIWHIIGPMFEEVMDGKGIGFPYLMLPLNRNGYVEECYFDFSYSPIRLENGEVGGVLVTVIETTERKKSLDALEESEKRFRAMADNIPNLAWMADAEGSIYWYNKQWFEYSGTTHEQMQGWGWQALHDPHLLPGVLLKWKKSIATGKPFEMIFPLKGADGHYRQFLTRVNPVYDQSGRIFQWFGSNTDVTSQIEIEESLNVAKREVEESERNMKNMILQAPVAMCIFRGPDFVVEVANKKVLELWGKQEAEVMGKPIFEGLPEAKEQGLEQLLNEVYYTGERFIANEMPVNLPRHGRIETTYINFVYEALHTIGNSEGGVMAAAIDVTDQVAARHKIEDVVTSRTRDLGNANNDLKKSNAELAQFAYIASHDLQEPLRKITTYSQILENSISEKLDDRSIGYLQKINHAAIRMNKLIRDVLTYSELVKEQEVFTMVDLNKIIENILVDYELLIEQKNATIACETLPVIEAIPLQMSQLFGNLIGNSLKFLRDGVKPHLEIKSTKATESELKSIPSAKGNDYIKITFSDNGIGIDPQYTIQIFSIFQRLHRKSEFEGTGIGLAMCKKIALNHNGEINADGSNEKGAKFNIFFPIQ